MEMIDIDYGMLSRDLITYYACIAMATRDASPVYKKARLSSTTMTSEPNNEVMLSITT